MFNVEYLILKLYTKLHGSKRLNLDDIKISTAPTVQNSENINKQIGYVVILDSEKYAFANWLNKYALQTQLIHLKYI